MHSPTPNLDLPHEAIADVGVLAIPETSGVWSNILWYIREGFTALGELLNSIYTQCCVHATNKTDNLSKAFINYGHKWVLIYVS